MSDRPIIARTTACVACSCSHVPLVEGGEGSERAIMPSAAKSLFQKWRTASRLA